MLAGNRSGRTARRRYPRAMRTIARAEWLPIAVLLALGTVIRLALAVRSNPAQFDTQVVAWVLALRRGARCEADAAALSANR
jgi:hypothetical protein